MLRQYVQHEQACCPFFDFSLEEEPDAASVTITAPPEVGALLDLLSQLAAPSPPGQCLGGARSSFPAQRHGMSLCRHRTATTRRRGHDPAILARPARERSRTQGRRCHALSHLLTAVGLGSGACRGYLHSPRPWPCALSPEVRGMPRPCYRVHGALIGQGCREAVAVLELIRRVGGSSDRLPAAWQRRVLADSWHRSRVLAPGGGRVIGCRLTSPGRPAHAFRWKPRGGARQRRDRRS